MSRRFKTAAVLALIFLQCFVLSGCAPLEAVQTLLARRVEFSCGKFPVNARELSLRADAEELALLEQFSRLESLDLSGSTCYAEIGRWAENHPHIKLSCEMPLPNGQLVQLLAEEVDLSGLVRTQVKDAAEILNLMPQLRLAKMGKAASGADALSFEDLLYLENELPGVSFNWEEYRFDIFGQSLSLQASELELSGISSDDVELALELAAHMPRLEHIDLGAEREALAWEDVYSFQCKFPEIEQSYEFQLYGKTFNIKDTSIDLSYTTLKDKGEALGKLLPYLPRCTYVNMDTCGISNEEMAELQARFPDKKLVWRLFFGKYTLLTDEETLLASKPSEGGSLSEHDLEVLKYTTDLKYLDLGHNGRIGDLSFLEGLTELEVGIFALTAVRDISGIENCVDLEYLELYISRVNDLEPLRGLTKLRHLNIGRTKVTDISPLYDLELERLWIGRYTPVPQEQIDKMQELHPDCVIETTVDDPDHGGWRYISVWPEEKHPRYALLREQFGYTYSDYNFAWNDEEYWDYYRGRR